MGGKPDSWASDQTQIKGRTSRPEREPGGSGDVYVCVGGSAVALMLGGEETGLCKGNE